MPKNMHHKIVWLTLPIALLNSVTVANGSPRPTLSYQNTAPGSVRLTYLPFKTINPTPTDIERGYDWATKTETQIQGQWAMPPDWKFVRDTFWINERRLVYRRGRKWSTISLRRTNRFYLNLGGDKWKFAVDLNMVPRNADEIWLQGIFGGYRLYSGPIPRGWKPPSNVQISRNGSFLHLTSQPFDVLIKAPGAPFPKPVKSWPDDN